MADFGTRVNDILKSIKYSLAKAEVGAYNDEYKKYAEAKSSLATALKLFGKIILFCAVAGLVFYAFWSTVMVSKQGVLPQNTITILMISFVFGFGFLYGGNIYENVVYKENCKKALKELKKSAFSKLFSAVEDVKDVDFQEKQADRAFDMLSGYGLVNLKNATAKLNEVFRFEYKNLHVTVRQFSVEGKGNFFTAVSFKHPKNLKGLTQLLSNKTNISGAVVKGSHIEANDADFNKNYKVFATDKMEAGAILAPDFVDWLKKHAENTPGIVCVSGRLYVVLNNFGTGFELLLTEKTLDSASVLAVNDFIKILDFIDSMQL